MNSATLPRDTPTLQALVVAQQAEIEHLKLIIAKLRRMQFGQSSEKIDEMVGQLELLNVIFFILLELRMP